jgi:pyruvate kinase
MIIEKCIRARKVVITATQMLDSMIKNPRPTRAMMVTASSGYLPFADSPDSITASVPSRMALATSPA